MAAHTTNDKGDWNLAAIQMSFIAGTPGAPPIPGTVTPAEPQATLSSLP